MSLIYRWNLDLFTFCVKKQIDISSPVDFDFLYCSLPFFFLCLCLFFFFSVCIFFHEHSRITGLKGKRDTFYLTPLCHFHLLHRQLDISQTITRESLPLHIVARLKPAALGFHEQVANH